MPRGKLEEKSVKKAAISWLAAHYESKDEIEAVVSRQEVRLKKQKRAKNRRADGLIVMLCCDEKVTIASIEAKSSKTYRAITPDYLNKKWVSHAALVSLAVTLGVAIIGWGIGGWFLKWVVPVTIFLLTGFTFMLLTSDHKRYRPISVVDQIKRYPANYQWIALSADMYNKLLPREQYQAFLKDCTQEGVGLLRVGAGNKITIIREPVLQKLPRGHKDFLEYYAAEKELRHQLLEKVKLLNVPQLGDSQAEETQLDVAEITNEEMTFAFEDVFNSDGQELSRK